MRNSIQEYIHIINALKIELTTAITDQRKTTILREMLYNSKLLTIAIQHDIVKCQDNIFDKNKKMTILTLSQ